ncbi:uncharacterized protein FIBRA_04048 [Fibroporia radiculosa]|uniref:Phosphatidylinositol N-acetylglucosaminyltransferase n=1 Tax=Fibroporia radiculosa TaxID=599839 RepID=J4GNW3_9APHY|nr:uncharacterized protein FIBRA_04048 [Fibroporia radiculosa]CCM01975.1 predicted protein [Fibroporia radiculosa]
MDDDWERVLWKKKVYPDNYVPSSFLSSLTRNPNFRPYTYMSLVFSSCAINQHLSTIFTFLAVFVRLNEQLLDPRVLVWLSICGFIAVYAMWELLDYCSDNKTSTSTQRMEAALFPFGPRVHTMHPGAKTIKSSILVFLALMSLSPVLKTLTAATSSDSIWALSASLFILNALLADYTALRPETYHRERRVVAPCPTQLGLISNVWFDVARLTSVLSMNAAISAAVVLASRLPDDISVFALMLLSIQLFALFPILRRRLQGDSRAGQVLLTSVLSASSILSAASLSFTATCLIAVTLAFVTFVAPGVLVWAQKYKNEIRGTWDPAVPKVHNTERPAEFRGQSR